MSSAYHGSPPSHLPPFRILCVDLQLVAFRSGASQAESGVVKGGGGADLTEGDRHHTLNRGGCVLYISGGINTARIININIVEETLNG